MEKKRTFFPEVETVWHKDYQTDYYRGVIIDQDDNVAERCPELRASYYSAKKDAEERWNRSPLYSGKSSTEIMNAKANSWDAQRGIWIPNTRNTYILIAMMILVAFGFSVVCGLIWGDVGVSAAMIVVALGIIIGIPASARKQVTAFGAYIWDKDLYIVILANENISSASILQDMGFPGIGLAGAMDGQMQNARYLNQVTGINKVLRISGHKTVWKITQIHEVKETKKGVYRVKASYYKYSNVNGCFSDKERNIRYTLRRSNFEAAGELVSCIKYVKDRTVNMLAR